MNEVGIEELLLAAGPGRVRLGIDIEAQRVAFLAPGGAGGEFSTVGHHHLDGVIVRMQVRFHGAHPARLARAYRSVESRGSITRPARRNKA
jgi:hypothetical protein